MFLAFLGHPKLRKLEMSHKTQPSEFLGTGFLGVLVFKNKPVFVKRLMIFGISTAFQLVTGLHTVR